VSSNENIYDKLLEYFGLEEENISILEETISTDTQIEYFEFSRNFKAGRSEDEILRDKDHIFDSELSVDHKKTALVELASINNITAFRTIEKYLNQPNNKLYDWACLALQESKMHLESSLLDESKVLITTGLGGRGLKLRYFIVMFTPDGSALTTIQQKILCKELNYFLPKHGSELENVIFDDCFASILAMVPIRINLQNLFHQVISECNQLGNYLYPDFIITNLKILTTEEVRELLQNNNIF